jgi:hypothetical protein
VEPCSVLTACRLLILRNARRAKKASLPIPLYVYCTKIISQCDRIRRRHDESQPIAQLAGDIFSSNSSRIEPRSVPSKGQSLSWRSRPFTEAENRRAYVRSRALRTRNSSAILTSALPKQRRNVLKRNSSSAKLRFSSQDVGCQDNTPHTPTESRQISGYGLAECLALKRHLHVPGAIHQIGTFSTRVLPSDLRAPESVQGLA